MSQGLRIAPPEAPVVSFLNVGDQACVQHHSLHSPFLFLVFFSSRRVTCLAKVCTLLTWCPRVQTTVTPPSQNLWDSCCWLRLPSATCESHYNKKMCQNVLIWINEPLGGFCYRHELKKASHISKLPKGKHSVKGQKLFTFTFHSSGLCDSFSYKMINCETFNDSNVYYATLKFKFPHVQFF